MKSKRKVKEETVAKEEGNSPKYLEHKDELVKKDKDKSEECSEIKDKESDDKTVDLSDKGIKNKKVKNDQELTDLRNLSVKW